MSGEGAGRLDGRAGDRVLDHVAAAKAELSKLLDAVRAGPMTDPVPTCPGWTVADLVSHVGQFCGFWTHVLCEGTGAPRPPFTDPPSDERAARWLEQVGGMLVTELEATPPSTRVWTWFEPDRSASFVARRTAHELAVHRYDVEVARRGATPIAPELAADGLEELLLVLVTARERSGSATGQTLELIATDIDGVDLLVALKRDVVEVSRARGSGDLVLSGSASDLLLTLYRRPTLGSVETEGDRDALEAWYREFVF